MQPFLLQNVSSRWFDGGGRDIGTFFLTRFEGGPRLDVNESKHQGSERPNLIGTFMGGEGSVSIESDTGSTNVENLIGSHVEAVKANSPSQFLTFVVSFDAPQAVQRGERFSRVVLINPRKSIDGAGRLIITCSWRSEDWNQV